MRSLLLAVVLFGCSCVGGTQDPGGSLVQATWVAQTGPSSSEAAAISIPLEDGRTLILFVGIEPPSVGMLQAQARIERDRVPESTASEASITVKRVEEGEVTGEARAVFPNGEVVTRGFRARFEVRSEPCG